MAENPADENDSIIEEPMNDIPTELPSELQTEDDSPIIDGPPPFHLDDIKASDDDDEPSEFGDDDALLSVAEGSESFANGASQDNNITNNRRDSQQRDSMAETQAKSSQGKSSSGRNSSRGGAKTTSSSDDHSLMTGIKTAEVRKSNPLIQMASQRKMNLPRKSLEHIADFSLDGLVGRDGEVAELKAAFDRMVQSNAQENSGSGTPSSSSNFFLSNKEVFLIKGLGGIGKSVIARTLEAEVGNTGIFVGGKFDMNSTDEPYSAIASAYGKICQHIKNKMPEVIPNIQEALEQDLGDEARLLVQLISDLNYMLKDRGDEVRSSDIDLSAIENGLDRMRYSFRVLTRIFSKECSPMVIFLDDLQWADISSLQMIDFLMTDTSNPHPLMILGCYRSEEVDENSLLHNKIVAMREKSDLHGFTMTEMEIGPFQVPNIVEVIGKMMPNDNQDECQKLAELCLKRTLGNVFFVLEFLRMLQLEQLVAYDFSSSKWSWDLSKIEEDTMSTANVAMLLQERMRKLPQQVQSFLQCAAYLGSTFSVASITAVWNTYGRRLTEGKMEKAQTLLDIIHAKDFVEKYGTRHYRWVHDKIQEAAFDVRPIRESFQLDIGTSLYYSLDPQQLEEDLFTVVDLINTGNVMKRPEYAEVNLRAAQKAMSVSAYQAAAKYASYGIDLLQKNGWIESRSLMVKLYTISAEAEVINGNIDLAEQRCQEVLSREEVSDTEKLTLKLIKERVMMSSAVQSEAALKYCLELLNEMGCPLYRKKFMVTVQSLRKSFALIKKLKKLPAEEYDKMDEVVDRKQKAIVSLLSRVSYHALNIGDFLLGQLATCKMIDMTLEHGIHEASASSIGSLGVFLISLSGDFETALALSDVALHMIAKSGKLRNGETIMLTHSFVVPVRTRLEDMQPQFYQGYTEGLRVGDTENAFWCWMTHETFNPYYHGRPLDNLLDDIPSQQLQYEEASEAFHIVTIRVFKQVFTNLKVTSPKEPLALEGEVFSKSREGEDVDKAVIPLILLAENELHFFSGDYVAAAQRALKVGDDFEKTAGFHFMVFLDTYHRAAALYAAATQTKQRKYRGAARKLRNRILKWKDKGNPNVTYYCLHLNAEQALVDKKFDDADQLYKDAIKSVTEMKHLHHSGFICERYADFLERDRGSVDESKKWRKESIEYYRQWGSVGRAEMLESRV